VRSWPSPDVPVLADLGIGPSDQPVRARDTSTHELTEIGTGQADVSIYVCGITPYDATHLGHAATYLLFDTLERVLLDAGKRVHYVQNVTDIDDPLLERAAATGEDWAELAERETELFRTDMTALRILAPQAYVGAVEAIPDITAAISELQDRGAAYDLDDDIYFSVAAAPHFGEVGRLDSEQMVALSAERGGDPHRPGKKDPLDCLLWQGARPGEPSWDSVVGAGRPGWHVECAAIARRHLGAVIDVQGGGDDLVFPHHELGAAEASVLSGEWPFARAFVHQAMVGYAGEKMSKSKGNLVLVSQLRAAGVDPMAIRLALLDHLHTNAWAWQDSELGAAADRLGRWRAALARVTAPPAESLVVPVRAALRDGLRTPDALVAVDEWCARDGDDAAAPRIAAAAIDALLGITG
jgi:L-cysteine:1D-myo-inositol 2-amino-2-deoxy-alpha-D-glucopyranoside ligase